MGKRLLFLLCLTLATFCSSPASAAPQTITTEGTCIVGDTDAPKDARDAARKEALRAATEQAGVYVESYTETKNLTLTKDEVRVVAGSILKVLREEAIPEIVDGKTWQYRVRLTCTVDTDAVDVESLAHKKEEIARLEQEHDALRAQNSAMRLREQVAKNAAAAARGSRLEDAVPYSDIFDETQRLIDAGESAAAVQEISRLIGDPRVTGDALAYAHVLRGRAYYELGDDENAVRSFAAADEIPCGAAISTTDSSANVTRNTDGPPNSSGAHGKPPTKRIQNSPRSWTASKSASKNTAAPISSAM